MTEAEFIKQTDFVIDRLYARTVRKGLSFSKRDAGELVTEAQNVMVSFLLDEMS
nr:hypothetical protein [Candidatus Dadabacteria bacterium]